MALKKVVLDEEDTVPSQVVREIKLLKAVKHPHIVHLQDGERPVIYFDVDR